MPRWTPEARLKQALAIRSWSPWTKSTGPRSPAGKSVSSRNAWKGGVRANAASYAAILRMISRANQKVNSLFCRKRVSRNLERQRRPQPVKPPHLPFPPDPDPPEAVEIGHFNSLLADIERLISTSEATLASL